MVNVEVRRFPKDVGEECTVVSRLTGRPVKVRMRTSSCKSASYLIGQLKPEFLQFLTTAKIKFAACGAGQLSQKSALIGVCDAAGRPVISSDVGWVTSVIRPGGFLLDVDSILTRECSNAVRLCAKSPEPHLQLLIYGFLQTRG